MLHAEYMIWNCWNSYFHRIQTSSKTTFDFKDFWKNVKSHFLAMPTMNSVTTEVHKPISFSKWGYFPTNSTCHFNWKCDIKQKWFLLLCFIERFYCMKSRENRQFAWKYAIWTIQSFCRIFIIIANELNVHFVINYILIK